VPCERKFKAGGRQVQVPLDDGVADLEEWWISKKVSEKVKGRSCLRQEEVSVENHQC
jgi:hypothetical protein